MENLEAVEYAKQIVIQPQFDGLHDPDKSTEIIEPYRDPVGFPTIGYGHLLSRDKSLPLSTWDPITVEEALRLLEQELIRSWRSVQRLCPVALYPWQAGALIDFAFNCGAGNLQISTLRKRVNRGDPDAADEFLRWDKAGGVRLRGLVLRRRAERDMFNSGGNQ